MIDNQTSDPEYRYGRGGVYRSHLLDLPQLLPPSDFRSVERQRGEVVTSDADGPTYNFVCTYDERSRFAWKSLRHRAGLSIALFGSSNDERRVRIDQQDDRDT